MSGEKISGLAVVASAQIDPSVQRVMQQDLPAAVRAGSNRVADELEHLSTKTKNSLNSTFGNMEQYYGSVLDRMAQRMAKGNFSLNTENALRGIKEIADGINNLSLSFTAGKLLDLGEQLRLPKATQQVQELRQEFTQLTSDLTKYQSWLAVFASSPQRTDLSNPLTGQTKFFAETHGEFNQRSMQDREAEYNQATADYYSRQEALHRAGLAGRRIDEQSNITSLSPAALASMEHERQQALADKYNNLAYPPNGPPLPPGPVPLSPAALAAMQAEFNASRTRGQYDYSGTGQLGLLPGTVPLSPAVLALHQDEMLQHGRSARERLDQYGVVRPTATLSPAAAAAYDAEARQRQLETARRLDQYGMARPTLSPAAIAARQDDLDQRWRNARSDTMTEQPGEALRTRIFEHARRQEAETRQLQRDRDRYQPWLNAPFAQPGASPGTHGFGGPGQGGRLGMHDSHRIRFASQNLAFGIDDAIQSYHYGGVGASIRAASNNATAIAGMTISNPAIAAGSVVAISIVSAILPMVLQRYGLGTAFQKMSSLDKELLRVQRPGEYNTQERLAGFVERTQMLRQAAELGAKTKLALGQSAQEGNIFSGVANVLDSEAGRASTLSKISQEQSMLEREQVLLERRTQAKRTYFQYFTGQGEVADFSATTAQALEDNYKRQSDLKKEARKLEAERIEEQRALFVFSQRLPEIIEAHQQKREFSRETDFRLAQGEMSVEEYKTRIRREADLAKGQADVTTAPGSAAREAAYARIDAATYARLSDPFRLEQDIRESQYNRQSRLSSERQSHNRTMFSYSGDTSRVGQLTESYNGFQDGLLDEDRKNRFALQSGRISHRDYLARQIQLQQQSAAASGNFTQNRVRAFQDDIENLNPERNPLLRLQRKIQRQVEDLEKEKNLTPEERRQKSAAILTNAAQERSDLLRPSGTRRFSAGSAIDVNSAEDLELKGRMTGSFEWEKKLDTLNKTQQETNDLLRELLKNLTIEAERLGRK